jgi:hypothetical protein
MFWLWLIVAVVLFGWGMYWFGTLEESASHVRDSVFWLIIFSCAAWPLIVGAAIVGGPFMGLYTLGTRKRKKKQADDSN